MPVVLVFVGMLFVAAASWSCTHLLGNWQISLWLFFSTYRITCFVITWFVLLACSFSSACSMSFFAIADFLCLSVSSNAFRVAAYISSRSICSLVISSSALLLRHCHPEPNPANHAMATMLSVAHVRIVST